MITLRNDRMANRFLSAKVEKTFKFMGLDINVSKLTVAQVMTVREKADAVKEEDTEGNIDLLLYVISCGAAELSDVTAEDMKKFPMDELTSLSNNILAFSGLSNKEKK